MMYAALEEQYAASEGQALSFTTSSSATSSEQYVSRYLTAIFLKIIRNDYFTCEWEKVFELLTSAI